jgi:serine phosphatase RsbU (regulator of sigma subunit)
MTEPANGWRDITASRPWRAAPRVLGLPRGRLAGWVVVAAAAWFVLVWIVDLLLPDDVAVVIILIGLTPLFVSAVLSPGRTALVGLVCLAVAAVSPVWDTSSRGSYVVRVLDVAILGVTAVLISVVRERRERHLSQVVAVAEAAQRAVLPTLPSRVGDLRISARYHSAAEEALIGGDLYDFHLDDETGVLRVVVGDVCGKRLDGVQHAARTIRAFRQYAGRSGDLVALARRMNDYLVTFFDDESFVTAVLVEFAPHSFSVVSCGHPAPLLVTGATSCETRPAPGPPLGLGSTHTATTSDWSPGDRLLLYTDGLVEARDARRRFLPLSTVGDVLVPRDHGLDDVVELLERHVPDGRLSDDVCLLLVDRDPSPVTTPRG